jgi:hypothetical protein
MKKAIITTTVFLLYGSASLYAHREVAVQPNDSLTINLKGYKEGSAVWQRSADKKSWLCDSAADNPNVLRLKATAPLYFRLAVAEDDGCGPYYSDTLQVNFAAWLPDPLSTDKKNTSLNAGRGYVEPQPASGLSMSERGGLSGWTDSLKKAVWYLYQKPGRYTLNFVLTLDSERTRSFKITCSTNDEKLGFSPVSSEFSYTGKGRTDTLSAVTVDVAKTGYYKYELESKNAAGAILIHSLLFKGIATPEQPDIPEPPHTTDYLSSPSVHLGYHPTTPGNAGVRYDWFYQELMAPSGFTPVATYYMAIGFDGGYFGMQANSLTERRILFSVWDQIDLDYYKKIGRTPPKDSLVSLVDCAPYAQANSFGGEGTGGQSYVGRYRPDTWIEDTPVKFLLNVRRQTVQREDKNGTKPAVLISAWYKAYEDEGWRYIATWCRPFVNTYFDAFHSFLENYGWTNGHLARKAYYYHSFGRRVNDGQWVHFNRGTFGNTDGKEGQRVDIARGAAPEDPAKFYMLSGGYLPNAAVSEDTVPLIANPETVVPADLTPFMQRVDDALVNDSIRKNLVVKEKTSWSVRSFSSEETSGEGTTNGRAALIVDGDAATYWHSRWTGTPATFPHWFVVDMAREEEAKGFRFTLSGGSGRYMKNIRIEKSGDGSTWETIFEGDAPNQESYILPLDNPATFRYFKLTISSGFEDGVHTRINEIDVY